MKYFTSVSVTEISIYCYLLSIEDRETYQCYPSYKTIGKALGMSENTVSKYVRSLEEKGLIRTEPTMVREQRRQPPQRKPDLHYPSDPGGSRIVLRAALPAVGGGCRPSEGGGTPRRIGP